MRDLRTFETFYWVAKLGGFRAAATKLHTTQPAISARIAQLEQELGVELFDANRRRATLTARGALLVEYAERLLKVRDELLAAVAQPAALRGKFTIGTSETLVRTWLSSLIEDINGRYPNLIIDIAVDNSPELRQRLLAQDIDLALMTEAISNDGVHGTKLCSYEVCFVVAQGLAGAGHDPADAAGGACGVAGDGASGRDNNAPRVDDELFTRYPIITWPAYTLLSTNVLASIREALDLSDIRIWGVSSVQTIIDMVHAGRGIGALSSVLVKDAIDAGVLRALDTSVVLPQLDYHAVYLEGTSNNALKREICALARDAAARHRGGTIQVFDPADKK
ncbi:hypothetical protein CEY04_27420 [Achromobacter sp. HZ28]|nr:hypothetical protein CEY05_28590 [Achromobacter sp. HZ34]OWT70594.1 hypothetical protein CEY04_27420 [Achromobacter sp. HZ28]